MPRVSTPTPALQATPPASAGTPQHQAPTGPVPGDEITAALMFTAAAIKHFDDRSDLSTINGAEFLQMAEEAGIMERTKYDPKAHAYLKEHCASRNVAKGDEVLALSEAGLAILASAEKEAAEAGKAAGQPENKGSGNGK